MLCCRYPCCFWWCNCRWGWYHIRFYWKTSDISIFWRPSNDWIFPCNETWDIDLSFCWKLWTRTSSYPKLFTMVTNCGSQQHWQEIYVPIDSWKWTDIYSKGLSHVRDTTNFTTWPLQTDVTPITKKQFRHQSSLLWHQFINLI